MLKIHQIFLVKFFFLFVGALFLFSIIIYVSLKESTIQHKKTGLEHSIILIGLELEAVDDLELFAFLIHDKTDLRVTIIDNDGAVMAESNIDKMTMDNHANRYEIMQANRETFSHIVRYSKTLQTDFLYVAKKCIYRGKPIYIRLSMSLQQTLNDFYSLWFKLLIAFFIVLVIAFYLSGLMSKRVVSDIKQITNFLDEISNKNYNAVIKINYFYEFLEISLILKNLIKKLTSREKQKRKYTAKLRLMNKQREDILSAVSHELKNPVASIMGYAQTLEEDPNVSLAIRTKFLSKISSNGEKIIKILDRLALSVKLENNDLKIREITFDLKALFDEIVANLSLKYRDREIIVRADSTVVHADKTMVELVLINLLDNALKYSESDVELVLENSVVSVIDRGIGIKEEDIPKVMEKFYRVNKNSWDNSMGIGLAMVSHSLKAHHSELKITSVYGKGSTFSFSIKELLK